MIESLAQHGVQAMDLVPSLMTTHTVANPEYDPTEARRQADIRDSQPDHPEDILSPVSDSGASDKTVVESLPSPPSSTSPNATTQKVYQTTPMVLEPTSTAAIPGVSTTLSAADEKVTLDIRWTVLCDLFLVLIADSVYDARSRVLLERVASKLGLGWLDVVKFESRVTEALEIQEDVERTENQEVIAGQQKAQRNKRIMMLGLATLGMFDTFTPFSRTWFHTTIPRWRSCYWSICWAPCTCYWCRAGRCVYYHWHHRHYRVPCGSGRSGHNHHRRRAHRLWYSCPRYGQAHSTGRDIRYSTLA
jgi:hypothetical protein